jgi:ATP adenylyltransferase
MADDKTPEAYVNLDSARFDDQRKTMENIIQDGVCPFCPENLARYHKQEILKEGSSWLLTPNQWPYEHTSHHLLAIAKNHVESLAELGPSDFAELLQLFQWAETTYGVTSGGVAMRFGDVTRNGASVRHLHAHFIVPSDDKPAEHQIRFKIS